ncbi:hypothetical protein ACKWTF_011629 [Chironomus riparius]
MSTENIYYSSYPLLCFLKILGIFVPSFNRHGQFKIRIFDKIYFIFANSLMLILLAFCLMKPQNKMSSSLLITTAWEFCAYFGNIFNVIMMIYQYRHSINCIEILRSLNDFDVQVKFKYSKHLRSFLMYVLLG